MQTSVDLVAAGIGVALVAGSLRNLGRAGVVHKTLRDPSPTLEIGVVWPRDEDGPVPRSLLGVVDKVRRTETLGTLAIVGDA